MRLSFDQIREMVRACKMGALHRAFRTKEGLPLGGKFGVRFQREMIAQVLRDHAIRHGQLVYGKLIIGAGLTSRGFAGLRGSNNTRMDKLIKALIDAEFHDFEKLVTEYWARGKEARGEVAHREEITEVEAFASQHFKGFT